MDTIDFAETATIQEGFVMFSGRKLEPASAPARNQFGYELGYTWKEVAQIGASIWVEETGVIWCDDPERVPGRFVERNLAGVDLSGANLVGANLSGVDMRGVILSGAILIRS